MNRIVLIGFRFFFQLLCLKKYRLAIKPRSSPMEALGGLFAHNSAASAALGEHITPLNAAKATSRGGAVGGPPDLKRRRVAPSAGDGGASSDKRLHLPVTIITGFLGAGKSTLLNRILTNTNGAKVAVFVNELGKIDIDGKLVAMRSKVDDTDVVLLNNGCICCTINENLVGAVNAVLKRSDVQWLVIETTGAVDLLPLLDTFDWASEGETDLEGDCRVDSVIAVVDATSFEHADFVECTAARNQIIHADVLLLNKADLVPEEQLVVLEHMLQKMSTEGRGEGGRVSAHANPHQLGFQEMSQRLLAVTDWRAREGSANPALQLCQRAA